jgi:hypothetical protein
MHRPDYIPCAGLYTRPTEVGRQAGRAGRGTHHYYYLDKPVTLMLLSPVVVVVVCVLLFFIYFPEELGFIKNIEKERKKERKGKKN